MTNNQRESLIKEYYEDVKKIIDSYNRSDYQNTEIYSRLLISKCSNHPFAWKALGTSLFHLDKCLEALPALLKATQLDPNDAEIFSNLGAVQKKTGDLKGAILSYRKALILKPDFPSAHNNLANTLKETGCLREAIDHCRKAIKISPTYPDAYFNLGNILLEQGKHSEAELNFRQAIRCNPNFYRAYCNIGVILTELRRYEEAIAYFKRSISIAPDFLEAHYNLGNALRGTGRLADAESSYKQCIILNPEHAQAWLNLGVTVYDLGRMKEAEKCYRQVIGINPQYAEAYYNLGNSLKSYGCLSDAVKYYKMALDIRADYPEALSNLGNALNSLGKIEEAIESYKRSIIIKPDFLDAYSNMLFLMNYHMCSSPNDLFLASKHFETNIIPACEKKIISSKKFKSDLKSDRVLRVGYVSGDLNNHAVSYFTEQLFKNHNKNRIQLFAYASNIKNDDVTNRFKYNLDNYKSIAHLSDADAVKIIEQDSIDVLVDLSGHTSNNRLGVFARRAAPIQCHYLGFFGTTGLSAMDYWIGDHIVTPVTMQSQFVEKLWQLSRVWVSYSTDNNAPIPRWRQTDRSLILFGSFNNLGKITTSTVNLWSRILKKVPFSKLLLKAKELMDPANRDKLLYQFRHNEIDVGRIIIKDNSDTPSWRDHMAYYEHVDIALDPIGAISGGTTTCDALWMGVPVVTLLGSTMGSRMSASMLDSLNLNNWIANCENDYVEIAIGLANNISIVKEMRFNLRDIMIRSPLCDASDLAVSLEDAFYEMHKRWVTRENDINPRARGGIQ